MSLPALTPTALDPLVPFVDPSHNPCLPLWSMSHIYLLYCITPALDGYLLHLDRTPYTQMMTSLNICGTVLYNTWQPCSHASLFASIHPICLCPSELLPSKLTTHHQLISTKLG